MTPLDISAVLADRNSAVLLHETEYDPASGAGSPVAPATYASKTKGEVSLAEAAHAIIPTVDEAGFHVEVLRGEDGRPVIAPSVILSSVAAESSRMDEALWRANLDADLGIPAIIVDPAPEDVIEKVIKAKLAKSLSLPAAEARAEAARQRLRSLRLNSVTLPHRHVDGWIRGAIDPATGRQVWAGGTPKDAHSTSLYQRISTAGSGNHVELLRLSPTALLGGFWLSTGAAQLHKRARAVSGTITGYDAHRMSARATKMDELPVSADATLIKTGVDGFTANERKNRIKKNDEKDAPSSIGLGQVPGGEAVRVTCGAILGSTTITLSSIREVLRGEDVDGEYRAAAQEMLLSLALLARVRADEDTYIRSECSLVDTATRWGLRVRGSSAVVPVEVDAASVEDLARESVVRARALGVVGDPTHVTMSEDEVKVVVDGFFADKKNEE